MLSEGKMRNLVRNKAKEYQVAPQQMYSLFGLEEVLKRLADSPYKDHLIIKGGFLLSTMYGLENRSTMDLDTTVQKMKLDRGFIDQLSAYLEQPYEDGSIHFQTKKVRETRINFDYSGFNLKLEFLNGAVKIPIDLDITTGEMILPAVEKDLPLLFGEGTIQMPAYQTEQILADKLYTTLAYGAIDDTNSRTKDLYDIYYLSTFQPDLNYQKVRSAVEKSIIQREQNIKPDSFLDIFQKLKGSERQHKNWENYRLDYAYAVGVTSDQMFKALEGTLTKTFPEILREKSQTVQHEKTIQRTHEQNRDQVYHR